MTDAAVERAAALVAAAPPAFGATRVLGIDGRSGAGKSTFARALAHRLGGAPLVQLEGLYEGWEGLQRGLDLLVDEVLGPLSRGEAGWLRQYDWARRDWGEPLRVAPAPVLVLEGVGAGSARVAPYLSALVWLEVPADLRRQRALARDGETFVPHWDTWAAQEQALLDGDDIAARATLIL